MKQKVQPKVVQRIVCPNCKELMIKIYPYSSLHWQPTQQIPICGKCLNLIEKKKSQGKFIPDMARMGGRIG